jgi:diguanylate cyclase (GGDEF)-like protein/PAS domain S-box-containing protein
VRFGDLIVEEDRGRVWEEIQKALAEHRSFGLRYAIRRRDGEIRHVQEYGQGLHDEDGEVVALEGLVYDITELVRAEERLRESEERYRTLVERIPAIVYVQEPGEPSRTTYVSPQNEQILGYSPEECLADPDHWIKILHPDDRERVLVEERRTNGTSSSFATMEYRQFAKDGRLVWIRDEAAMVRGAEGEPLYWLGVQTDITERMQAEEERSLLASLVESSQDAIFATTPDAIVTSWNQSAERLYGYSAEEMIGQSVYILMPPDRLHRLAKAIQNIKQGQSFGAADTAQIKKDGGRVYTSVTISPIKDPQGNITRASVIARDITKRKALEEQLEHQAFHDILTDLPNRHLFMDRLRQTLRRTTRARKRKVALLFMDLDNFKIVNDSLGHELGDKLLVALVERLRGSLRPEDTLARFGGDEFTVLIENVESPEDVVRVAERIVENLREPFVIEERELFVRASIGIALGDTRTKSEVELLRDADMAMYRAKDEAVDYRMYDPGMYERVFKRLELENDLRRALEKEEFRVHYQPKFRLGQPDRIEGVEALIRWEHPQRGFMLPDEFIPIAEATGLIIPIGGWVMKEACHQAKEWQERHPSEPPLSVCVNLSAAQVRHPGLLQDVSAALRESGLEPGSLTLEITEGTLLKDTKVLETIFGELKALGVRLAIDDFGKEYSSLSYLKRLPVDVLKIDGSFVGSLGEDPTNTTIVEAVIKLAHSLGLEVTGEGVESAEQLAYLRRMGCDHVQGYFLAKPQPSEEVESLLADQPVY